MLQVVKNGSHHASGCPDSYFHPSQRSITVSLTVFSSEKVLQASLPVTIRRCIENKLAEVSSRLRQPEQIQKLTISQLT